MSITPTDKSQQPVVLYKYRFTPKTPNIGSGVEVLLPDPQSVLLSAFIVTDEAWNGTTPHADFGFTESGDQTVFTTLGSGAVDVSVVGTSYGGGTESGGAVTTKPLVIASLNYNPDGTISESQTATALYVRVNETGAVGGTASGSTSGSSTLYLVFGTPVDLSVALDQPQL